MIIPGLWFLAGLCLLPMVYVIVNGHIAQGPAFTNASTTIIGCEMSLTSLTRCFLTFVHIGNRHSTRGPAFGRAAAAVLTSLCLLFILGIVNIVDVHKTRRSIYSVSMFIGFSLTLPTPMQQSTAQFLCTTLPLHHVIQ